MENKYSVILVDDHQMIIDGLKSMLARQDKFMVINEFTNPIKALENLKSNAINPNIIIVDVSMPEMDGIEFCKAVKALNHNTKIMILTMHDQVEIVKKAILADADGYMLKNSTKQEFIAGLNHLVENGNFFSREIMSQLFAETAKTAKLQQVKLTPREVEILQLIALELTSKEIADKLNISKQTVDTHRINLMTKTNSKSMVGLIRFGFMEGIIKF